MKVGDYVRTIYGIKRIDQIICGQDVRFDNTDGFDEYLLNYHNYDGISINSNTWKEIVIGEPKEKPIDLIEVGDILYLEESDDIACMFFKDIYLVKNEDNLLSIIGDIKNKKCKLISILTKEQFSQMEYKVGE